MAILHIDSPEQFKEKILDNEQVCIVDFYADWCMPCKMQAPILEELADEVDDVVIAKVNVDEMPDLAGQYEVQTIPNIVVIKSGEVKSQVSSVQPKDALEDMIHAAR